MTEGAAGTDVRLQVDRVAGIQVAALAGLGVEQVGAKVGHRHQRPIDPGPLGDVHFQGGEGAAGCQNHQQHHQEKCGECERNDPPRPRLT